MNVYKLTYQVQPSPKMPTWIRKYTEWIHADTRIEAENKAAYKTALISKERGIINNVALSNSDMYEEFNFILKRDIEIKGCQHPRETCDLSVYLSDETIDELATMLEETRDKDDEIV